MPSCEKCEEESFLDDLCADHYNQRWEQRQRQRRYDDKRYASDPVKRRGKIADLAMHRLAMPLADPLGWESYCFINACGRQARRRARA